MGIVPQKRACTRCNVCKPISEFYKNKYSTDGYKNSCKECDKKLSLEKRAKVLAGELPNKKTCRTCGTEKPISEFYSSVSTKDGYSTQCKRCTFWEHKIRGNVPDRKKVPIDEQRWKSNIRVRRFKDAHPELVKERGREYYARNKEKILAAEFVKRRSSEYRTKHRIYANNRRARVYENGGSFTDAEWGELCDRYGNRCLCCGNEKPLTIDHVIPVSMGGTSDISNIQPLCLDCNMKKHTQTTDYRV